jgi:multiple sugar transport system permease protein
VFPVKRIGLGRWVDQHISWFFILPAVLFLAAVVAFPVVYTIGLSFFNWSGATTPPAWVGFGNYADILSGDAGFLNALFVTAYVTGVSMLIEVTLGVGLAQLLNREFIGKGIARTLLILPVAGTPVALALSILVCRMLPGISFLVPWFIVFRSLGILDTYTGLIIAHLVITVPLITWIMIGFFEEVPVELEDAARIDGFSRVGVFLRIALPLVRPGLVSAAILALIFTWNSFLLPLILAGVKTKTLPVVVYSFITFDYLDLGGIYAASTLVTLPVIVMVLLVQRQFIRGLTLGGVKG